MLVELAERHGLRVRVLEIDETGWDFRVGHAVDADGARWVLRAPRRRDVSELIEGERRLLEHMRPRLAVAVPDWEVCTPELIAYRRLPGRPLGPEYPTTLEYQWWRDPAEDFFDDLGAVIAELHRTRVDDAVRLGIPVSGPRDLREETAEHLELAENMLEVPEKKAARWRTWIHDDDYWSGASDLRLVHADLHPGHTTGGRIRSSHRNSGLDGRRGRRSGAGFRGRAPRVRRARPVEAARRLRAGRWAGTS